MPGHTNAYVNYIFLFRNVLKSIHERESSEKIGARCEKNPVSFPEAMGIGTSLFAFNVLTCIRGHSTLSILQYSAAKI